MLVKVTAKTLWIMVVIFGFDNGLRLFSKEFVIAFLTVSGRFMVPRLSLLYSSSHKLSKGTCLLTPKDEKVIAVWKWFGGEAEMMQF